MKRPALTAAQVVAKVMERPAGKIKSRGFPKGWRKPVNGRAYRV